MRAPKNAPAQESLAEAPENEQIDCAWLVHAAVRIMDKAMADREYEIASEALETLARITGHWPSEGGRTVRPVRARRSPTRKGSTRSPRRPS